MNFLQSVWYWRLAVVRCVIYGGIVAWGVFKAGTNGFHALSDMEPLQRTQLLGDMAVAFGGVLLAFLDTTMQRLGTNGKSPEPPKTP